MKERLAIVHYSLSDIFGETACGINMFNVSYYAYNWQDVTCKRCLNVKVREDIKVIEATLVPKGAS